MSKEKENGNEDKQKTNTPVIEKENHVPVQDIPGNPKKKNKRGRPTKEEVRQREERKKLKIRAYNEVAVDVAEVRKDNGRLANGQLDEIIDKKKKELGAEDIHICKKTIMSRQRPERKLVVEHHGPVSPMKPIEEIAIHIAVQLTKIGHPLTSAQGLKLVNSLIENTETQEHLKEWKVR